MAPRACKNGLISACRAGDHHGDPAPAVLVGGF
jgi:hypothetical protein